MSGKPDWRDAPDWAQWLALDPDGSWFWYEVEPNWDCRWESQFNTRMQHAGSQTDSFNSLEARP